MTEHIDWDSMLAKVKLEDDAVGEITPVLRPCPFCGGEALLEPYKARKGYEASIQCNQCLASMATITYDEEETAVRKVVEAWNRRAGE